MYIKCWAQCLAHQKPSTSADDTVAAGACPQDAEKDRPQSNACGIQGRRIGYYLQTGSAQNPHSRACVHFPRGHNLPLVWLKTWHSGQHPPSKCRKHQIHFGGFHFNMTVNISVYWQLLHLYPAPLPQTGIRCPLENVQMGPERPGTGMTVTGSSVTFVPAEMLEKRP